MANMMKITNPFETLSFHKLDARNLLDPSFADEVRTMPMPKCGPPLPGGPAPKCIGGANKDTYVTRSPVVHLYGVSPESAAKLEEAGIKTIGDMLKTKSDFSTPNFTTRVRNILQRVKAGVQKSTVAG